MTDAKGPLLFRSSEAIGWEGLVVRAYHEPMEMESWIPPTVSALSLVLFTCGTMHMEQRRINGPWKERHIREGDLVLRPSGRAPYELRWTGVSPGPLQTLHLYLSEEMVSRTAGEVIGRGPARLALVERVGFRDPLLTQIGLALGRELEQRNPAGRLYAETAAQMLAVHLLHHYAFSTGDVEEPTQGLTRRQTARVTDFIETHLGQDLSLEIVARQIDLSPYHFARMFRRTIGESPHQYVLRRRVERAGCLLEETDVPLAHVALESGFANQSHLTQVFKRYRGLTPRAYRRDRSTGAHS